MVDRKFRFGVTTPGATSFEDWLTQLQRYEGQGIDVVLMPDHFRDQFDPMCGLAAAAAVTGRVRLGTLVLSNDFRHPCVLAREATTLDVLSKGRLELGIGAGWASSEYQRIGMPFGTGKERLARLRESVMLLKAVFRNSTVNFQGEFYHTEAFAGRPRPAQENGPPIFIGGGGPRILQLAGEVADIVGISLNLKSGQNLNPSSPEFGGGAMESASLRATREAVRLVEDAAGDRFDEVELSMLVAHCVVTADREIVAGQLAERLGVSATDVLDSPHMMIGSVADIVDRLQRLREETAISYVVFRANAIDSVSGVVEALAGT